MNEFGSEVLRLRNAQGLSQDALAKKVFLSKSQISKTENGRSKPSPETATRLDEVLGAGGALLALVPKAAVRPRRGEHRPHGLPDPPADFTGRAALLAEVAAVLHTDTGATARVCALHGLAGSGKTALALAAAAEACHGDFPDGAFFFDLGGHTPGARPQTAFDVLGSLLPRFGITETLPPDLDGRLNTYRDLMRTRGVLLVLDNAASAEQVRPLVPPGQLCRVLVTSRSELAALDGAHHVHVDVLDEQEAVHLLGAQLPDDRLPDPGTAREVVELCDRLPLAIRIAAAQLRGPSWAVDRFRARLADERTRLAHLDDGERAVAAAFAITLDTLPEDQRWFFGLLACHPGGPVEPDAAEAMAGLDPGESDRLLARLRAANLLRRDPAGHATHDLVRLFAVRHALPLVAADTRRAALDRLIAFTLDRVAAAAALLDPHRYRPVAVQREHPLADRAAALEWFRAQAPTLERVVELALRHGALVACWQLAYLLRAFYFHDKRTDPWLLTHEHGLTAARAARDDRATGMMLNSLGMAHLHVGSVDLALAMHREAYAAATAAGDEHGALDALSSGAWARVYCGQAEAAVPELLDVLAAYRAAGRGRNAMITLRGLALALTRCGRSAEAFAPATEALELARTISDSGPDSSGVVMGSNCLAWVHYRAGEHERAAELYAEAAEWADLGGDDVEYEHARALTGQGNAAARRGEPSTARARWAEAAETGIDLHPVVVFEEGERLALLDRV
ncbi:XRE family transcriptional regulator [Actinokineospora bangkokensis]|uniref:HTH cro/C1-type domain-containing protein n=1 Tax=Actinokineospora bangkokensis TaxID=1193682 RepID=A0A1Q9LLU9_9PSEU|nr:XRE family transcriptional regulator [Actinokineospora bangkokensis]OLR93017.1 hypothetical protein BJP25_18835 [Actinokineospora bangkokensis]